MNVCTRRRRRACKHTRAVPVTETNAYVIKHCPSCGSRRVTALPQQSLFSVAEAQLMGRQMTLFT